MNNTKLLGDVGETLALQLLRERGYTAELLPTNSPTYDIRVLGANPFFVSVKAAQDRQHVRLGSRNSVERLDKGHFVFALLPLVGVKNINVLEGVYRVLIVPAEIARADALILLDSYITEKGLPPDYQGRGLMVKGYSKRAAQQEVWARWAAYEDAWHRLPQSSDKP